MYGFALPRWLFYVGWRNSFKPKLCCVVLCHRSTPILARQKYLFCPRFLSTVCKHRFLLALLCGSFPISIGTLEQLCFCLIFTTISAGVLPAFFHFSSIFCTCVRAGKIIYIPHCECRFCCSKLLYAWCYNEPFTSQIIHICVTSSCVCVCFVAGTSTNLLPNVSLT